MLSSFKWSSASDKFYRNIIGKDKRHHSHIKFVKYRNMYNMLKRKARESYYHELLNTYTNDIRKTWSWLNYIIGRKNDKITINTSMYLREIFTINGQNSARDNIEQYYRLSHIKSRQRIGCQIHKTNRNRKERDRK